jgi:hypothetical protein
MIPICGIACEMNLSDHILIQLQMTLDNLNILLSISFSIITWHNFTSN